MLNIHGASEVIRTPDGANPFGELTYSEGPNGSGVRKRVKRKPRRSSQETVDIVRWMRRNKAKLEQECPSKSETIRMIQQDIGIVVRPNGLVLLQELADVKWNFKKRRASAPANKGRSAKRILADFLKVNIDYSIRAVISFEIFKRVTEGLYQELISSLSNGEEISNSNFIPTER